MAHLFGSNNLVDNATLSMLTGDENAQFPLTNIQLPITGKVFRADGATVEIQLDLGTMFSIDTFMLVGDSIEGLGVSNIELYGSTTSGVFDPTPLATVDLSSDNNFGFKQFTEVNYRYWKLKLEGSTFCELSNIFIGKATSFATNAISLGSFKYLVKENMKESKNNYGTKFINKYNTQKTLSGDLKLLNSTEYNTIRTIYAYHRKSEPLWFITDPLDFLETDAKYIYSGFFYLNVDVDFKNTHSKLWSTTLSLTEVV